ncbi:hypothetical protein ACIREO_36265 [Streptomyces sp. NPDC102441]|uniref:hypothetical protein n=1 Tax=Streptomyces sp. NPDC102441 TaxID=3366176 RepID=UPI00382E38AA
MTHLRTERTRARTLVTAIALAAAFLLPTVPDGASAATGTQPAAHHSGGPAGEVVTVTTGFDAIRMDNADHDRSS